MKRISIFALSLLLVWPVRLRGQDAAVEERLTKLATQLEDLQTARVKLDERISELTREVSNLRDQTAKPTGNFASQEDLRKLAEQLQEIDRKRVADNEKILKEIEKILKVSSGARSAKRVEKSTADTMDKGSGTGGPEKGFEYVIQSGDTLSTIALAYREKGVKTSTEQILKANPGLKPTSLQVGQKIFIPAP